MPSAYPTINAALATVPANGSATVCVDPAGGTITTASPGGARNVNGLIDANKNISFVPGVSGMCLHNAAAGIPVLDFNGAGSSTITGFFEIQYSGPASAIQSTLSVVDSTVTITGSSQAMIIDCIGTPAPHCIAGNIGQEGVVFADLVSWEESRIGLHLHGGSATVPGGQIDSSQSNVKGNNLGLLVEDWGDGTFYRDAIRNNAQIAHVDDHAAVRMEDTGIVNNSGPKPFGLSCVGYSGYWAQGVSVSTFHNVLWHSNCSLTLAREAMLQLEDGAFALVQNNTMANNDVYAYVQTKGAASLTLQDSILADTGPAITGTYPSDDGVLCSSTGTHTLDEMGSWQLQASDIGCPMSSIVYTANPLFEVPSANCVASARPYYLMPSSPYVNKSSRAANHAAVLLSSYVTAVPTTGPCTWSLEGVTATDLGFHWWPVP